MHFLGLAGMPRRIPDYPDSYADFNSIATIGSYVSLVSLFVFGIMIVHAFLNGRNLTSKNY
jgi:heme/copper-type cytochrome/quinol oxidase subunit 1